VHGTADERDRRQPHGAGAAADRSALVGAEAREGALGARTGAVTVVQRTSSDLRLNPHLQLVALDGAWHEQGGELCWQGLGHLQTSEVGAVLESTVRGIERQLRRRGLLGIDEDGADPDVPGDPESNLTASAVSGQTPPDGLVVVELPL
jgi:hypothetical protein